jgi:single-stranded DNA-binding protein
MAETRKNVNFVKGLFAGNVHGLQTVDTKDGKSLVFNLEIPHQWTDSNGQVQKSSDILKMCVHPSQVPYVGKNIIEGQGARIEGQLQVKSGVQQPDGSWHHSWCVMVTNAVQRPHIDYGENQYILQGNLSRDAKVAGQTTQFVTMSVACNDRFGEGTSFIDCASFSKNTIQNVGYYTKGRGVILSGSLKPNKKGAQFGVSISLDPIIKFVGGRANNAQGQQYGGYGGVPAGYTPVAPAPVASPQQQGTNEVMLNISDDDLPF